MKVEKVQVWKLKFLAVNFLSTVAMSGALAQTQIVVDNVSASFVSSYAWSPSTSGSNTFMGGNHLVAAGFSAGGVVDNDTPKFTTTGTWQLKSNSSEIFGANFKQSGLAMRSPRHYPISVIDNTTYSAGGYNNSGQFHWRSANSLNGYYGKDYSYLEPGDAGYSKKTFYRFESRGFGDYSESRQAVLSAHWPASPSNASNAKIRVLNTGGSVIAQYTVNQRVSSGEWTVLGAFTLNSHQQLNIEFDATGADGRVVADAIKIESQDAFVPDTARWELPSNLYGDYDVYARWPDTYGNAVFVGWTVVGGNGMDFPIAGNQDTSQKRGAGEWHKIGKINLQGQQKNYVLLEGFGYSFEGVSADAVSYFPTKSFPEASWTADTQGRLTKVFVSWSADSSRVLDARYIVKTRDESCNEISTSILVDQRDPTSAASKYLGSFISSPNCGPMKVVLMPNVSMGTLSADSTTFELQ